MEPSRLRFPDWTRGDSARPFQEWMWFPSNSTPGSRSSAGRAAAQPAGRWGPPATGYRSHAPIVPARRLNGHAGGRSFPGAGREKPGQVSPHVLGSIVRTSVRWRDGVPIEGKDDDGTDDGGYHAARDDLGAAMAAASGPVAMARPAPRSSTFVLVRGSSQGGWCRRRVSDRLERRGHKVFTPGR